MIGLVGTAHDNKYCDVPLETSCDKIFICIFYVSFKFNQLEFTSVDDKINMSNVKSKRLNMDCSVQLAWNDSFVTFI
jgi:hypothetical protein